MVYWTSDANDNAISTTATTNISVSDRYEFSSSSRGTLVGTWRRRYLGVARATPFVNYNTVDLPGLVVRWARECQKNAKSVTIHCVICFDNSSYRLRYVKQCIYRSIEIKSVGIIEVTKLNAWKQSPWSSLDRSEFGVFVEVWTKRNGCFLPSRICILYCSPSSLNVFLPPRRRVSPAPA